MWRPSSSRLPGSPSPLWRRARRLVASRLRAWGDAADWPRFLRAAARRLITQLSPDTAARLPFPWRRWYWLLRVTTWPALEASLRQCRLSRRRLQRREAAAPLAPELAALEGLERRLRRQRLELAGLCSQALAAHGRLPPALLEMVAQQELMALLRLSSGLERLYARLERRVEELESLARRALSPVQEWMREEAAMEREAMAPEMARLREQMDAVAQAAGLAFAPEPANITISPAITGHSNE